MSNRGKRGVAKCKKKLRPEDMHISFDENYDPIGPNASYFDSWLGLETRTHFPEYWIKSRKFEKERWDNLWLHIKKKSDRASKGAKLIKVPSRTGRSGYRKVKDDFHKIWPPIVNANSQFNDMNDHRCQLLMAARVKKDPKTDTYDTKKYEKTITSLIDAEKELKLDGTYGQGKKIL
ncbi:hypothetical protein Hanom_Chr12g01098221 [Helianthus anomalus]